MSGVCVRHGSFVEKDKCQQCQRIKEEVGYAAIREAKKRSEKSRRPDCFEEAILAPRFLVGEEMPDFTKRHDLVVYVYACRAPFACAGRWSYTVLLVDLTLGSTDENPVRGVAYRSSRPCLMRRAVAEEYLKVAGVPLDLSELETVA